MGEITGPAVGAQSACRVLQLLKRVASHQPEGVRLKMLVIESGLDRSTAHRLLGGLVAEGFVERTDVGKRYRLGLEAMQLGLASVGMPSVVERFRPMMRRLARETGDTVFLIVRSEDYALCLHREEGPYPVKAFVVSPGTRRLLGLSSVGLAILALRPEAEIAAAYARHMSAYERAGVSLDQLHTIAAEARRLGYAESMAPHSHETSGVGCAFRLSATTYAGVSIAAINSRMPAARKRELGERLVQELGVFAWAAKA